MSDFNIAVGAFAYVDEINPRTGKPNSARAYVSVTIDDLITIHNFSVVKWNGKLRLDPPKRRVSEREWKPVVDIINPELLRAIQNHVLGAYYTRPSQHASGTHESNLGDDIRSGSGVGWRKSP